MGKKSEKSIRGKKVFKQDKDFPIVKDRETMQIFSRILEILEILEIFFQNLGDSGKPYSSTEQDAKHIHIVLKLRNTVH